MVVVDLKILLNDWLSRYPVLALLHAKAACGLREDGSVWGINGHRNFDSGETRSQTHPSARHAVGDDVFIKIRHTNLNCLSRRLPVCVIRQLRFTC